MELRHGDAHDAAAVLVKDGEVVAAIEEERLDRIKHSNQMPVLAMRACLAIAGVTAKDLDRIAYAADEAFMNAFHLNAILANPALPRDNGFRAVLARALREE